MEGSYPSFVYRFSDAGSSSVWLRYSPIIKGQIMRRSKSIWRVKERQSLSYSSTSPFPIIQGIFVPSHLSGLTYGKESQREAKPLLYKLNPLPLSKGKGTKGMGLPKIKGEGLVNNLYMGELGGSGE